MRPSRRSLAVLPVVLAAMTVWAAPSGTDPSPGVPSPVIERAIREATARFGEDHRDRVTLGVRQAAARWWPEDGDADAFVAFCRDHFIPDEPALAKTFARLTAALEQVDGRINEIGRELRSPIDLDTGPIASIDLLLGDLDLGAHVEADLFRTKAAFLALLNYPIDTLATRLEQGSSWSRERWARSRMMDRFALRLPAEVSQKATVAFNAASRYIDEYNIRVDRLVDGEGRPVFPGHAATGLITHWGLRDELKSHYGAGGEGLAKQRAIQKVMERIVRQEIPEAVRDNGDLLWNPFTNEVRPVSGEARTGSDLARREPDTRYARLLDVFRAVRAADPFAPTAPTYIQRKFEMDRQIPEKEVEALLVSVATSDEIRDLARVIEGRLGRPLEPFDIWYAGFTARAGHGEDELDAKVRALYPTVAAFQEGLPRILTGLGFGEDKARWLAGKIVVDPSRGAGHAMQAVRREDAAHLRTRIPEGGMLYKGYNIAIHELGHNVEQVFSLNGIDNWWLRGVPNNAFTEALAFVFQERDLELLGLGRADAEVRRMRALGDLWATYEIGGVSLVDMAVWRWMYAHPEATASELRDAALAIARDVWNRYYAPIFRVKDVEILAVYSHMIAYGLYLPDYALGHIIAFQVARRLRERDFGAEFERVARQGRLTPDAWMRGAVGAPLSARALLDEAREALTPAR